MKIDDFLGVKQVRCIRKDCPTLTAGKTYAVLSVTSSGIKTLDDENEEWWSPIFCFEPVTNSAETPPRVAEPKFAAGEKVYFSTDPDIKIVSDVNNDNTVRFMGESDWVSGDCCCPATQENYEKLCSLFECIDFEQPPTQADIDNEAVDKLAQAMKNKLAKKREQGYHGWETCKHGDLVQLLINHVDKGDPIDVANFCAFFIRKRRAANRRRYSMNKNRRRRHQFYYERLKLELAFRRKAKTLTINTEMLTRGRNVRAKTTNAG